jgi:hypothetical protein
MAITTTAMTLGPDAGDDEWGVIFYSADFSGAEDIKAAVTGEYHYIDELYLISNGDSTVDIGSGQGTAVTTKLLSGIGMVDGSEVGPLNMRGQQLVVSQALSIDASAGVGINGYAIGHTGPDRTATKDL